MSCLVKILLCWIVLGLQGGQAIASDLAVRLIDHVSSVSLVGQAVHAYEKGADGTLTWKAYRTTNGEGWALFDLEGLGSGKTYVLQAKPYGYWAKSEEQNAPGSYGFRVGKLQVQVLDGQSGQGRGGQQVHMKRWSLDGNHVWVMEAVTDAQGWVRLDPPDAGKVAYVLTATSPTDGQEKVSGPLWGGPAERFVLGNAALVAHLQDGLSGVALPGHWVEAWEKLSDGSHVLRGKRKTDTVGQAKFDLDGLGGGRTYQFRTKPFAQTVTSSDLVTPGFYVLKAGKFQVAVNRPGF